MNYVKFSIPFFFYILTHNLYFLVTLNASKIIEIIYRLVSEACNIFIIYTLLSTKEAFLFL